MSICELHDATKTYGSGAAEVFALDKVSVAFESGEFTAISGPSGSGKTTMLNLVGLLDVPTSGTVRIAEQAAAGLGSRALARLRAQNIGFIFQSFNLVPVLTATENVEMALHLAGTAGNRRQMAEEALAAVGLGEMLRRRPAELSGGQQQRVAVARALVKKPALVIADEPTANLDSTTGGQILDLMRRMNDEGAATFIFSTHDPMVMERARRIIGLHDGRVETDDVREAAAGGSGGA
jgi:putative ABC transport system ATP-binding protein